MANILIDFEKTRVLESGLGQFGMELGAALIQQNRDNGQLQFFLPPSRIDEFSQLKVQIKLVRRWQKASYGRLVRNLLNRFIPGPRYDLWHITNQSSRYEPWNRSVPVVLTIHDLNFLRERKDQPDAIAARLKELQKKVDRACCISAISNFVAGEVREHLDLRGKPLRVIYNGAASANEEESSRPDWAPQEKFLFSIGWFGEKKNFHVLVEMLEHLPEYHLVLAGVCDTDYGKKVLRRAAECEVADRTILPGPISNAERQWLYANCTAFTFPSLTEGFGLPVIEAMKLGKPVFMSTATSLPEIGGSCGFYWNNFESLEMAATLRQGMEQVEHTPDFSCRVQQHASQFTWAKAAREYLGLYQEVIDGSIDQPQNHTGLRRAA